MVFTDNEPPPRDIRPNNKSDLSKPTFLWEELVRLEELGCTKSVAFQPHIVNPCYVVYSKNWLTCCSQSRDISDIKFSYSELYFQTETFQRS